MISFDVQDYSTKGGWSQGVNEKVLGYVTVVRSAHPTLTPASSPIDGEVWMSAFLHFLLNEGNVSTGNPSPRLVYTVCPQGEKPLQDIGGGG